MTMRKSRTGAPALIAAVAAAVLLSAPIARAATLNSRNLTQLISESQSIIEGTVQTVTDGIDGNGIPYTEVTIYVGSSAKGSIALDASYTFRQFGLIKPLKYDDGRTLLTVTPDGFARWHEGESVIAFLYQPASITGLQTTVGLAQGKFTRLNDNSLLANEFGNVGLFEGVQITPALLSPEEQNMLTTPGAVDSGTFMNLVYRAVTEQWIEKGEMQ